MPTINNNHTPMQDVDLTRGIQGHPELLLIAIVVDGVVTETPNTLLTTTTTQTEGDQQHV